MNDPTLPLPGLSPVSGKTVVAKFDGGLLSSNGGVLALREVEKRLRVADRFAACIKDPRAPDQITHTLTDIICFRLLMIAAGYEDGNDASDLRRDPLFKMALDRPGPRGPTLASSSRACRPEALVCSMKRSIAGAAPRRTTSKRGRRTWLPIGPPARRPPPTSSGCFCMPARIGCCGACARSCPNARCGAWRSSTPYAFA